MLAEARPRLKGSDGATAPPYRAGRTRSTSFEEFYDRYHRQALGLACRIVRRADIAEQIVLEAFLDVWRSGHADAPAGVSPRTRLMATIRHHALDRVRSEPPPPTSEVDGMVDVRDRLDAPASAAGSDTGALVRRALAGAEPSQLRVLELAYVRGLSRHEIAARLGIPADVVMRDLRSALDHVRSELGIARTASWQPRTGSTRKG